MDSATMIRAARQQAGMTQAELAARAHTSAPTISAYEHGARQPRADVLIRILQAAGFDLARVPASTANSRYVDLMCEAMANQIRRDPDTLRQAEEELARMPPNENVRAWRTLLAAGVSAVVSVLTSHDPEARGLKADNPFARLGLVDEDTRLMLLDRARGR